MTATVIAFAQRKGGAGKTTLAAHLAITWALEGLAVSLIDIDPQGSLAQWHRRREELVGRGNTGIDFEAVNGWRARSEISRRARDADIVLLDSPAGADGDTRSAIGASDLVLVPVQPSPVDVWASRFTLEIAQRERVPTLLVLNRVPARACLTSAMREWLDGYEVGLASITIGNRVRLAAALAEGRGIGESDPGSVAAQEIASLAAELSELTGIHLAKAS
jgi:chromosome partitioning protein